MMIDRALGFAGLAAALIGWALERVRPSMNKWIPRSVLVIGVLLLAASGVTLFYPSDETPSMASSPETLSFGELTTVAYTLHNVERFLNPDAGLSVKNITILAPNVKSVIHTEGIPVHVSGSQIIGGVYGIDASKDSPVTVRGSIVKGRKKGIQATDHSPVTIE